MQQIFKLEEIALKKQLLPLLGSTIAAMLVVAACSSANSQADTTSQPSQPATTVTEQASSLTEQPNSSGESAVEITDQLTASNTQITFYIVPEESEARFKVNEVLTGSPKNVVGTTHDVEGSLVPDFENPANTTVGTIRIDLSTLTTDSGMRNRAIHDAILQTGNDAFRYAEFTPTSISGLPDNIEIGQPFTFQITGNLTIHGVTKEKTFDVTVTPTSNTRLEGVATLTIQYAEFDVAILRLPRQVASVEDQVVLELQFVATPD